MRSFDYSRLAQKAWDTDITVSNTKCVQAVRLYRKNGFAEMPAD